MELVKNDTVSRLHAGAALWDGEDEWSWYKGFHEGLTEYQATGKLSFYGGVLKVQQGNRTRTNDKSLGNLDPRDFDVLDAPDIDSCTISLSALHSSVSDITVTFNPSATTIEFEPDGMFGDIGSPLGIASVEETLRAAAEPWITPVVSLAARPFTVFLGHGNDTQWRDLRDDLKYHHKFEVDAFEAEPRSGHTIKDVLESMVAGTSVAVLVLVKSNQMADGTWQGRQNVIHEIGYFQGRLGWNRAIIVVEEGVVLPSNFDGTQQIRFPTGVIKAASSEVVATLNRIRASGS